MWKESVWCRNMWPKWILTLPLPKYQRGPRPLPAPSVQGIWPPPLITRGGLCPLPTPSCPGRSLISPSNHQRGLRPFQSLPAQECLWSPPPLTRGAPPPSYPLPSPYIPSLAIGESVYKEALNKDGSGVTPASPAPWIMYVNYSCLILSSGTWSVVK